MGERKRQRDGASKPIADQHCVLGYSELVEPVFDYREIGVHKRQHCRLRSVKARQIEQRDAVLGGEPRQHRIKGETIGKQ